MKEGKRPISVWRSGHISFKSRPALTYSKETLMEDTKGSLRSSQRSSNSRPASAYSKRKTEIRFNTKLGLRSEKGF